MLFIILNKAGLIIIRQDRRNPDISELFIFITLSN